MGLTRFADAVKRKVEQGQQEQLSQGLPADRLKNQLPARTLPPATSTTRGGVLTTDFLSNPMTTAGDLIKGGASGVAARLAIGSSGHVLTVSGGAPVWAAPSSGGGNVSTGTAITLGGLSGSPDVDGAAGGGTAHEFEVGDTAPTWSGAPAATDVGVTAASHLYVRNNSGTELRGLYAWVPGSGAFDARCKIAGIASDANGMGGAFGLLITSAGDSDRLLLEFEAQAGGQWQIQAYTYTAGSYTARGSGFLLTGANDAYLRITRDGSNNVSFWLSSNGLAYEHVVTQALTLTVAHVGFRSTGDATGIMHVYVDWLRSDV